MERYLNPPADLPKIARRLSTLDWSHAQSQLKPDEVLFGLGDNLMFKNARYLCDKGEYDDMYSGYARGFLVSMTLYAMPIATFEERMGYTPRKE